MIHPSISELTNNNKINRYTLVVATAKCARIITDEYVKQREYVEKLALSKEADKKSTTMNMIKKEYRDDKAVKTAITGLYNGEFKMVAEDGTEELLGHRREEDGEGREISEGEEKEKIDNYSLDANTNARPTEVPEKL